MILDIYEANYKIENLEATIETLKEKIKELEAQIQAMRDDQEDA